MKQKSARVGLFTSETRLPVMLQADRVHTTSIPTSEGGLESFQLNASQETTAMFQKLSGLESTSVFADTVLAETKNALDDSQRIRELKLKDVELSTSIPMASLSTVAKLIKEREALKVDRAIFYVEMGGFDSHNSLKGFDKRMSRLNDGLKEFVSEMEDQKMWEHVTIVSASEFGRNMSPNGKGTDHGWGGNHMVLGGSINGGMMHGEYPSKFGHGRSVRPRMPWEGMWKPIADWFGVRPGDITTVLPNVDKFKGRRNMLIKTEAMFKLAPEDRLPQPPAPPPSPPLAPQPQAPPQTPPSPPAPPLTPPQLIFVSNDGSFDAPYYTFSPVGATRLQPGSSYVFQAAGISRNHPFAISTARDNPLPASFQAAGTLDGLTGTGGQISFTIPADYTGDLVYFCIPHPSMTAHFSLASALPSPPSAPPSPPAVPAPAPPAPPTPPQPPAAPVPSRHAVRLFGTPYQFRTAGIYFDTEQQFGNGAAIYQRTDQYGVVWSLYRRKEKRKRWRWVLDYNEVKSNKKGVVAYSKVDKRPASLLNAKWKYEEMKVEDLGLVDVPDVPEAMRFSGTAPGEADSESKALCDLGEPTEEDDDADECGDRDSPPPSNATSIPQRTVIMIIASVASLLTMVLVLSWFLCRYQKKLPPQSVATKSSLPPIRLLFFRQKRTQQVVLPVTAPTPPEV